MKLLTKRLRQQLTNAWDKDEADPMIYAKFFYPCFSWSWYAFSFDGNDIFYGFVDGDFPECGSFSLSELLQTRDKLGQRIERDRFFTPCRLSQLRSRLDH